MEELVGEKPFLDKFGEKNVSYSVRQGTEVLSSVIFPFRTLEEELIAEWRSDEDTWYNKIRKFLIRVP